MLEWLTQIISALPPWFLIALLVLIVAALTAALTIGVRTGRAVHFWPPGLGESRDLETLQERLKVEQDKSSGLERDLESVRRELNEVRAKLAKAIRPLGSDPDIGEVLSLFKRLSLEVPAHEEEFAGMIESLHELRVALQQSGVQTIRAPLVCGLFEKMWNDLLWIENTAKELNRLGISGRETEVLAPMTLGVLEQVTEQSEEASEGTTQDTQDVHPRPFRPDRWAVPRMDLERTQKVVWTMIERRWRTGYVGRAVEHARSREISMNEMKRAMTTMYFFGAIDQIRASIRAEFDLLSELYKQEEG